MNEVEKMYSNAGVKKINAQYANNISYHLVCYPPFTAEKQLELIKWLIQNHKYFVFVVDVSNFEETLAKFINELAKDNWLTEEERKQIKEILE